MPQRTPENPVSPAGQDPFAPRRPTPRWTLLRTALYLAGLILLIAAIAFALRDRDAAAATFAHLRSAPWWISALLLLLPLASLALTSAMFSVLTRPYAKVPAREMLLLIGASWLLNYLPFRPGLIGRAAYLKAVHRLPITDAMKVSAWSFASSVVCAALALLAVAAQQRAGLSFEAAVALFLLAPIAACTLAAWRDHDPFRSSLYSALVLRTADTGVAALRFWLSFQIIGHPIDPGTALFLAGPTQVVRMFPMQLGAVEWVAGLMSPDAAIGVTAAVVNRATDLVVSLPVGLASLAALSRTRRQHASAAPSPVPDP